VKRYSSGMYVRLAFSVAAHMEPDILIIDEVLAVGDAEFQKKCLGKMDEITKKDGRTILFVSHNIDAIRQLCHKTIVLDQGKILFMGKTDEAISAYLNAQKNALTSIVELPTEDNSEKIVLFKKIQILNDLHTPSAEIGHNEKFSIEISYEITEDIHDALLCVFFMKDNEYYAISTEADSKVTNESTLPHEKGVYTTRVDVPAFVFEPGYYNLMISIQRPFIEYIEKNSDMYINIVRNTAPVHPAWKEHVSVKVAPTFHYHTSKQ
jgi:lipopolysaccharide transport system ATP-binding protein